MSFYYYSILAESTFCRCRSQFPTNFLTSSLSWNSFSSCLLVDKVDQTNEDQRVLNQGCKTDETIAPSSFYQWFNGLIEQGEKTCWRTIPLLWDPRCYFLSWFHLVVQRHIWAVSAIYYMLFLEIITIYRNFNRPVRPLLDSDSFSTTVKLFYPFVKISTVCKTFITQFSHCRM